MLSITSTSLALGNNNQQEKEELALFIEDMAEIRRRQSSKKARWANGSMKSRDGTNSTQGLGQQQSLESSEHPDSQATLSPLSPGFDDSTLPKTSLAGTQVPTILTINVSGLRFQTLYETVEKFPDTLLGNPEKRAPYFNDKTGEYFFDRHRGSFESILHFYQNGGRLKRTPSVPLDIFLREVQFYELGTEAIQKFWHAEGYRKPEATRLPENAVQRFFYQLMEIPDSSIAARFVAFVSISVIVLSTLSFCLETLPELQEKYNKTKCFDSRRTETKNDSEILLNLISEDADPPCDHESSSSPFATIETICITWFALEFLIRFLSCPSKLVFVKSFLNWVDIAAIVPFFVNLAFSEGNQEKPTATVSFAVLRVLRLVRVFRVFKLSRHSRGLQILGLTFQASIRELCLLVFFLMIGIVLFSSAVFFAENGIHGTKFTSIPEAFWYAIVTMTTVGYGDLTPIGPFGKLVGSMCAIIGVLVLALPVPVIVANFKHFYNQEAHLSHMQAMEEGNDIVEVESDKD